MQQLSQQLTSSLNGEMPGLLVELVTGHKLASFPVQSREVISRKCLELFSSFVKEYLALEYNEQVALEFDYYATQAHDFESFKARNTLAMQSASEYFINSIIQPK